jgi:serine/threonine-protein kinase
MKVKSQQPSPVVPSRPVFCDQHRLRAEERVGELLCQRWRLEELLGVGGAASVYAAKHRNGNRVAIKMLHPELSRFSEVRERFLVEAYAANRVGYPGVALVRDEGVAEDGSIFLVLDLVEGETLEARRYREGTVEPRVALRIADLLLDVLARAHERGVIHRDVKPDNIFLTKDESVVLLDFGVAHVADPRRASITEVGTPLGTPAFMPPEQARGRPDLMDPRSDIWAVGATLFTILSGHFVHEAETVNQELCRAMLEAPRSLGEVVSAPLALVKLVDRALAFNQEDRFPDARAMQAAVRAVSALLFGNDPGGARRDLDGVLSLSRLKQASTVGPPSSTSAAVSEARVPASVLRGAPGPFGTPGRTTAGSRPVRVTLTVLGGCAFAALLSLPYLDRSTAVDFADTLCRANSATAWGTPGLSPRAPFSALEDTAIVTPVADESACARPGTGDTCGADAGVALEPDAAASDEAGEDPSRANDATGANELNRASAAASARRWAARGAANASRASAESNRPASHAGGQPFSAWRTQVAAFRRDEAQTLRTYPVPSKRSQAKEDAAGSDSAEPLELREASAPSPDSTAGASIDPLRRRK